MSMVNRVEAELKMDVNEDISAASITANIRPERPDIEGNNSVKHSTRGNKITTSGNNPW